MHSGSTNSFWFWQDCGHIHESLVVANRFSQVWRIASGVAQDNGVGFRWQGHTFGIHWQQDRWYLSARQAFFCAATRQELISFCLALTSISDN